MEAIDISGNTKHMQYIAEQVRYIVQDVHLGVMDGACSGAINLLKCKTHSLDLFIEDLGTIAFAAQQPNSWLSSSTTIKRHVLCLLI
jgi:hypothetical protein